MIVSEVLTKHVASTTSIYVIFSGMTKLMGVTGQCTLSVYINGCTAKFLPTDGNSAFFNVAVPNIRRY